MLPMCTSQGVLDLDSTSEKELQPGYSRCFRSSDFVECIVAYQESERALCWHTKVGADDVVGQSNAMWLITCCNIGRVVSQMLQIRMDFLGVVS